MFNAPDHEYPSHLELILTATDSNGASSSITRQIDYRTVQLTFKSVPSGLSLTVNQDGLDDAVHADRDPRLRELGLGDDSTNAGVHVVPVRLVVRPRGGIAHDHGWHGGRDIHRDLRGLHGSYRLDLDRGRRGVHGVALGHVVGPCDRRGLGRHPCRIVERRHELDPAARMRRRRPGPCPPRTAPVPCTSNGGMRPTTCRRSRPTRSCSTRSPRVRPNRAAAWSPRRTSTPSGSPCACPGRARTRPAGSPATSCSRAPMAERGRRSRPR